MMKVIAIPKNAYLAEEERQKRIGIEYENYDTKVLSKSTLFDTPDTSVSALIRSVALEEGFSPKMFLKRSETYLAKNSKSYTRSIAKGLLHNETLFEFDMRCLLKYKELYGHITIKHTFTVPWNDNWPEEMWDLRLGNKLNKIRMMKLHRDKKEELSAIGVCYEEQIPLRNYGWDNISLALKTYKAINGHILIPYKFIIPIEPTVWPENLSGMRLGWIAHNIKSHNHHSAHRDEILAMGIKYAGKYL